MELNEQGLELLTPSDRDRPKHESTAVAGCLRASHAQRDRTHRVHHEDRGLKRGPTVLTKRNGTHAFDRAPAHRRDGKPGKRCSLGS